MTTEENNEQAQQTEYELSDELTVLKSRADLMGIQYSTNIGVDTLKKRIAERLTGDEPQADAPKISILLKSDEILDVRAEALKLIHVRIVSMDELKRGQQGELFSVGNSVIPTVRRFVPFNVATHVEQFLLDQIREKEYQYFTDKKHSSGLVTRESRIGKAYAIEVLPPLTTEELAELARSQAVRSAIDE